MKKHYETFKKSLNKACRHCNQDSCVNGKYLQLPNDPLHQKWICKKCIESGTSAIVKWNIAESQKKGYESDARSTEQYCPLNCKLALRGECNLWESATILTERRLKNEAESSPLN